MYLMMEICIQHYIMFYENKFSDIYNDIYIYI